MYQIENLREYCSHAIKKDISRDRIQTLYGIADECQVPELSQYARELEEEKNKAAAQNNPIHWVYPEIPVISGIPVIYGKWPNINPTDTIHVSPNPSPAESKKPDIPVIYGEWVHPVNSTELSRFLPPPIPAIYIPSKPSAEPKIPPISPIIYGGLKPKAVNRASEGIVAKPAGVYNPIYLNFVNSVRFRRVPCKYPWNIGNGYRLGIRYETDGHIWSEANVRYFIEEKEGWELYLPLNTDFKFIRIKEISEKGKEPEIQWEEGYNRKIETYGDGRSLLDPSTLSNLVEPRWKEV